MGEARAEIWLNSPSGAEKRVCVEPKAAAQGSLAGELYLAIGNIIMPGQRNPVTPFLGGYRLPQFDSLKDGREKGGGLWIDFNKVAPQDAEIRFVEVWSKKNDCRLEFFVAQADSALKSFSIQAVTPTIRIEQGFNRIALPSPLKIGQGQFLGFHEDGNCVAQNQVFCEESAAGAWKPNLPQPASGDTITQAYQVPVSMAFRGLVRLAVLEPEANSEALSSQKCLQVPPRPLSKSTLTYRLFGFAEKDLAKSLRAWLMNGDSRVHLIPVSDRNIWNSVSVSWAGPLLLLVWFGFLLGELRSPERYWGVVRVLFDAALLFFAQTGRVQGLTVTFEGALLIFLCGWDLVFYVPGSLVLRNIRFAESLDGAMLFVHAFGVSLLFWLIPALVAYFGHRSYSLAIFLTSLAASSFLLSSLSRKKKPWTPSQFYPENWIWPLLWILLGLYTALVSRFQGSDYDFFNHWAAIHKYAAGLLSPDQVMNVFKATAAGTQRVYAYNIWDFVLGLLIRVTGLSSVTVYAGVHLSIVFLIYCLSQWLFSFLLKERRQLILANFLLLLLWLGRSFGIYDVIFQKHEFAFVHHPGAIVEFVLGSLILVHIAKGLFSVERGSLYLGLVSMFLLPFFHFQFFALVPIYLCCLLLSAVLVSWRMGLPLWDKKRSLTFGAMVALLALGAVMARVLPPLKTDEATRRATQYFYIIRYAEIPLFIRQFYVWWDGLVFFAGNLWHWVTLIAALFVYRRRRAELPVFIWVLVSFVWCFFFFGEFNAVAEHVLTPILSKWPLMRLHIYVEPIAYVALIAFVILALDTLNPRVYPKVLGIFLTALVALGISKKDFLTESLRTMTFRRGTLIDISTYAYSADVDVLDRYATNGISCFWAPDPHGYILSAFSSSFAYTHQHLYPRDFGREALVSECLKKSGEVKQECPIENHCVRLKPCTQCVSNSFFEFRFPFSR